MVFFTVTYAYDPELSELVDEIHPTRRAFLSDLRDKGLNVASSPLGGDALGALFIIETETFDEIKAPLDENPLRKEKVVSGRVVRPWNPVISRF